MSLTSDHYIRLIEEPLLTLTPQGGRAGSHVRLAPQPQPGDAERNKYLFMTEREREAIDREHLERHGIFF
jgi:hypothetical protein